MRNDISIVFLKLILLVTLATIVNSLFAANTLLAAPAMDFIEKTVEGSSDSENAIIARKQIVENATTTVTTELLREMLGDSKFNKNRALLNLKIYKNTGRFIPVIKAGDLVKDVKGYKLSVFLQVNTKTLEAMLLENGLLYEFDSLPSILPMISIYDRVREKKVVWWSGIKDEALKNFSVQLEKSLQKAFWPQGFFVEKPLSGEIFAIWPTALQKDVLTNEEMQTVAQKLHSQVLLSGDVQIRQGEVSETFVVEIKLTATQVVNGRVLAESVRTINTERGTIETVLGRKIVNQIESVYKEMAAQLLETWQKGTFGATVAKLQVKGSLPIAKFEVFKETVLQKSRQVRQISERLISSDEVVFEMTLSGPLDQVANQLKTFNIPGLIFNLAEVKENSIVLQKTLSE